MSTQLCHFGLQLSHAYHTEQRKKERRFKKKTKTHMNAMQKTGMEKSEDFAVSY